MGCDIHAHAEKRNERGRWIEVAIDEPFSNRNYGVYGFLADVRNYSAVPPLAKPRGLPRDVSSAVKEASDGWDSDGHSHSWLSLEELGAFNYDAPMEDRRVTRQVAVNAFDGGCTADPGEGKPTTFREFLGPNFFVELARLKAFGVERVVFWFDN
jgi:hypothetical protein